jgi:hypothetical protein
MSAFTQLLNTDLFTQIHAFQRKSYWYNFCPQEQSYWKNRFTQDVIPQLDKGYRLVEFQFDLDGQYVPCPNCYHYGLCDNWTTGFDPRTIGVTIDHISHEEFRMHSESKVWNQEQYKGLRATLYGRYAMDRHPSDPNKLTFQLKRTIMRLKHRGITRAIEQRA